MPAADPHMYLLLFCLFIPLMCNMPVCSGCAQLFNGTELSSKQYGYTYSFLMMSQSVHHEKDLFSLPVVVVETELSSWLIPVLLNTPPLQVTVKLTEFFHQTAIVQASLATITRHNRSVHLWISPYVEAVCLLHISWIWWLVSFFSASLKQKHYIIHAAIKCIFKTLLQVKWVSW